MVASPLTLFAAFNAKAAASTGSTPRDDSASTRQGRDFASFLNNSSDRSRASTSRADASRADTARAQRRDDAPSTTQRNAVHDAPAKTERNAANNERIITPREAKRAIEALDKTAASDASLDPQAVADLRLRLKAVVDSDTPVSVDELLAGATPEETPTLLTTFQASVKTELSAEAPQSFQAIRKILGQINQALAAPAKTDVDAQASVAVTIAPTETDTATINLAAVLGDATKSEDATPENTADTVTTVTPLAQTLLLVPTTTASVDVSATTKATAAPTEAVAAVDVSSKPVTIDMLIPDIALTADEKKQPLPDIDLPKSTVTAEVAVPKAEPLAPVTALPSKLEQQLQALSANQQTFAQGIANSEASAKIEAAAAKKSGDVNASIQPLTGVGAATGVQASAGITTVASNIINHAPIREQVHVAISKAAQNGVDQITIQLDPLGLGRVEVKMHTTQDGQTSLAFLVDKPETFDALSRDARGLERALQDSGLKADSGGMQFNLRQQPQAHSDMSGGDRRQGSTHADASVGASVAAPQAIAAATTLNYRVGIQDGLDIHA